MQTKSFDLPETPLPVALPALNGVDLRALYDTVRTHGDFFDAQQAGPHLLFLLSDIAGDRDYAHPIACAMQKVFRERSQELFATSGINIPDRLSDLAAALNHAIHDAAHGPRSSPTFLGCYDPSLHLLTYLNAGGQTAVLRGFEGARALGNVSLPLGLFSHRTYEPAMQAFQPGTKLLLATKGVTDPRHSDRYFDENEAIGVLENFGGTTAEKLCRVAIEKAEKFRHHSWYSGLHIGFLPADPIEDLTVVALIRTP